MKSKMVKGKKFKKDEEQIKEIILKEKLSGKSDIEIGEKYGVSYKFIEKVITQKKGVNISSLKKKKRIKYFEPKNFAIESKSVWSFKQRGDWATHSGEYRGNYSPYIPRNIILRYSNPGDLVLDIFCGAGTTAIEAKLLGRRCIASDINDKAIELARENINFDLNLLPFSEDYKIEYFEPELLVKDARDLSWLKDESVDLICTHPPYANIIQYTNKMEADLSYLDIDDFLIEMRKVAKECFRVLKPGKQCALLIGDTRRRRHVIPLGFKLINVFLETGFYLRELIIKRQHNCKTTGFWHDKSIKNNFLLLAHEYLPVFEKPAVSLKTIKAKEEDVLISIREKHYYCKKEISSLETTSVWIFPEKEKETLLAKNLIQRYADKQNYICLEVGSHMPSINRSDDLRINNYYKLAWIKSSFINNHHVAINVNAYLQMVRKAIDLVKPNINFGGYLVIDTSDVRISNRLMPLAKLIVDIIREKDLWLKEIVIVTTEPSERTRADKGRQETKPYLDIIHSYILVYEKR